MSMEEDEERMDYMERAQFAGFENHLYFLNDLDEELFNEISLYDDSPEDRDVRISKYMSLENALNLLEGDELFLANPSVWQDPFESLFITAEYEVDGEMKHFNDLLPNGQYLYCTCFTRRYQSDAQWNMYNDHEIAVMIDFDAKKLFRELSDCPSDLYIGKVNYIEGPWNNVRVLGDGLRAAIKDEKDAHHLSVLLGLMLRKRINYEYENEIRLIGLGKPPRKGSANKLGITVKIPHIKDCITQIRVDPRLGPRTTKAIKKILEDTFSGKIYKSAMNNKVSFKEPIKL